MKGLPRTALLIVLPAGLVILLGSALVHWIPGIMAGPAASPAEERVTIDVRNAGGVSGMARAATQHLRSSGFDVVGMGNAVRMDLDSSVVIDRTGNLQVAAEVAEVLGIKRVTSDPDLNLFVDVSVQLGANWRPFQAKELPRRSPLDWFRGVGRSR